MTAEEAARELGVERHTIYLLRRSGKLAPKPGKWPLDFTPKAVQAFKQQREDAPRRREEERADLAQAVARLLELHSPTAIYDCALSLQRARRRQ